MTDVDANLIHESATDNDLSSCGPSSIGDQRAESAELKHTPGPWSVVDQHNATKTTFRVVCPDRMMPLSDIARPIAELRANAYLIAAAPDLKQAAELALKRLGELNRDDEAGIRLVLANAILRVREAQP